MENISTGFINKDFHLFNRVISRGLVNTSITNGITGNIAFNEEGDRIESLYEIINIHHGQVKVVGTYRTNTVNYCSDGMKRSEFLLFSRVLVTKVRCVDRL